MKKLDLKLYLVTDSALSLGRSTEEVVKRAIDGGVTAVQYREKSKSARTMVQECEELARICNEAGVVFIVNDRVDVAMACGADGVHLGQDDMDAVDARKITGRNFIIGVSVTDPAEAREAFVTGADYIAANGIFPTDTKDDLGQPLGIEGLSRIAEITIDMPLVAIGGINEENAGTIMDAGATGVAVVSFIVGHEDIEGQCRRLLEAISAKN